MTLLQETLRSSPELLVSIFSPASAFGTKLVSGFVDGGSHVPPVALHSSLSFFFLTPGLDTKTLVTKDGFSTENQLISQDVKPSAESTFCPAGSLDGVVRNSTIETRVLNNGFQLLFFSPVSVSDQGRASGFSDTWSLRDAVSRTMGLPSNISLAEHEQPLWML